MKKLLFVAALTLLATLPALAKSHRHTAPAGATASFNNAYGGLNDPMDVMQGSRVIGRDPDAGIRTRLFIQSQTGYYSK